MTLVLLFFSRMTWAGSCCVGATSTMPSILGECEKAAVGMYLMNSTSFGRWDSQGQSTDSSLDSTQLQSAFFMARRVSRQLQLATEIPVIWSQKSTDLVQETGQGVGDMTVTAIVDPFLEKPPAEGQFTRPVPVFVLGARMPTGRNWEESDSNLGADITGRPGPSFIVGARVERTLGQKPWALGATSEISHTPAGWFPSVQWYGNLGQYIGQNWSVAALATHVRASSPMAVVEQPSSTSSVGLLVSTSRLRRWRSWGSVMSAIPMNGLGGEQSQELTANFGYMKIW